MAMACLSLAAPGLAWASADASARADFGELPPPPERIDLAAEQRLELELFINGLRSGQTVSVIKQGARFQLRSQDLREAGLSIGTAGEMLFLDTLDGVVADYDAPRQQLHLTVSPEFLPAQRLGGRRAEFRRAEYDMGALLNYDVYVSGGQDQPVQASLWHEARVFGPAGTFSTSGALRTGPGGAFGGSSSYVRFDSYWRWSDERSMTTVEAGDVITRSLPWAPAVRLGGVQVSRDFSVRPDVVTYPLPEFAGSAALPSTVELVVGGQRVAGSDVNPGPFALETLPPINGYGEANLIVTDMHGRSVATSMPFYVSSALLRPGLTDYAVAVGAFRRNYGVKSFDYGGIAATISGRHGVTSALTIEGRAEAAQDMRLLGAGAVMKLGNFGVANASYSRSFGQAGGRDGHGGQLTMGYEYQARGFTLGVRHSRQDRGYVDIGTLDRNDRGRWERLTSATASVSLGKAGTLGAGYFDLRQERGPDARLANIAWTVPLKGAMRLHASVTREFTERRWSGALTLTVPLGRGTLAGGAVRDRDGTMGGRVDYAQPVPVEGGLGWGASAVSDDGGRPYMRGDVIWRGQAIQLRGGAYGRDQVNGWFGASGSLVFMDNSLFAANRVSDSFAVVSTNGQAGIPVRYENQLIGVTDKGGRLLVPSASAYYPARYDIDTLSLQANVRAPVVSQRVAIAARSGHVVRFAVERVTSARAVIKDTAGEVLPAGAVATVNGRDSAYIGWDGMIFLESVANDNEVVVALPEDRVCRARFKVDAAADAIIDLGELTCRP